MTATTVKIRGRDPERGDGGASGVDRCRAAEEPGDRSSGATSDKVYEDVNAMYEYATKEFGTYQPLGPDPQFEVLHRIRIWTRPRSACRCGRSDREEAVHGDRRDQWGGVFFTTTVEGWKKIVVFGGGDNEAADEAGPVPLDSCQVTQNSGPYLLS